MTDRPGRHAAARDAAETLIIPSQRASGGEPPAAAPEQTGPVQTGPVRAGPVQPGPEQAELGQPAQERPAQRRRTSGKHASGRLPDERGRVPEADGPHLPPSSDPRWDAAAEALAGEIASGNGRRPDPGGQNGRQGPSDAPSPSRTSAGGDSRLRVVWVYPDLLSTYGDRGNLLVLTRRAALRGIDVEPVEVNSDQPVPAQGDIYLLGGGEDLPQILAARRLRSDGGLARAADRGAVVFAVCAGYQVLGHRFGGVEGEPVDGLGILDISSGRGERRAVGELVADVDPALSVPRLTGFENHQGVTRIGSGAQPLATLSLGVGNGNGTEGSYAGKVLGTYLHGPALARNPGLADLLLSWVAGRLAPLAPDAEDWARQLRDERLAAVIR